MASYVMKSDIIDNLKEDMRNINFLLSKITKKAEIYKLINNYRKIKEMKEVMIFHLETTSVKFKNKTKRIKKYRKEISDMEKHVAFVVKYEGYKFDINTINCEEFIKKEMYDNDFFDLMKYVKNIENICSTDVLDEEKKKIVSNFIVMNNFIFVNILNDLTLDNYQFVLSNNIKELFNYLLKNTKDKLIEINLRSNISICDANISMSKEKLNKTKIVHNKILEYDEKIYNILQNLSILQ